MKKAGFTMVEMMVVMGIIAVLSVLTISSMSGSVNKNKAMFKKAYSIVEKNVSELINDETLYPYSTDASRAGFLNSVEVFIPNTTTKTSNDVEVKFCQLFFNNINTTDVNGCSATATDGIVYSIKYDSNIFTITMDVDNKQTTANTPDSRTTDDKQSTFEVYVAPNGKISLPDSGNEKTYLTSSSVK